jgi:uncharacterized protein (TIGR03437 family)
VNNPKNNGFSGDGGAATAAQLNSPMGVAVDAAGTLYIADQVNNRLRQVPAAGTISTAAGNGTNGYSGDGGIATSAALDQPCGVTVDPSGSFYIADYQNVVRKVTPADLISTVAGTGFYGFGGDGGIGISATPQVELAHPCGMALDKNGNLYIADRDNNRIRMVNPTGYITTVAGSGPVSGNPGFYGGDGGYAIFAGLNSPEGVAVNAAGNVYIADTWNNRIRKLTFGSPVGAIITTVAGTGDAGFSGDGGLAVNAQLYRPFGLALDAAGNLYFTDGFNNRIRKIDINGIITTVAGSGKAAFSGDGGPATSATLSFPTGIAVDASGKIFVGDTQNNVIRMLTPTNCSAPFVLGTITAGEFGAMPTVAPGSWVEIYGCNLAPNATAWDFKSPTAPTLLNGTSVTIGGTPAYLSYVSPTQVNALVPSGLAVGAQQVAVKTATGPSNGFVVNVDQASPGFWAPAGLKLGGRQYVGAFFKDGSGLVLPPGAVLTGEFAGFPSRPALPGDTIVLYGVGFGPVFPDIPVGQIVQTTNTLATTLDVIFGGALGTLAELSYAGLAVNSVGVYEIDLVVPAVVASNVTALTFNLGLTSSTQTLYIAVAN